MRIIIALVLLLLSKNLFGLAGVSGVHTGNVREEKNKALAGDSVLLIAAEDSTRR